MGFPANLQMPWLVSGDFNAFIKGEEKIGHEGVTVVPCEDLIECCLACRLDDLPGVGCAHTWCNNQDQHAWMRINLDRAMGNQLWFDRCEASEVLFNEPGISDHSPMVISYMLSAPRPRGQYKFLNAWTTHSEFLTIVRRAWDSPVQGGGMARIMQRLRVLKGKLRQLHLLHFSGIEGRIQKAREDLIQKQQELRSQFSTAGKEAADLAATELKGLLQTEELILKQQLKQDWLSKMDRGTTYFYAILKSKRRRMRITSLVTEDGNSVLGDAAIGMEFSRYFADLLGSDRYDFCPLDPLVIRSGPVLSEVMQTKMIASFTDRDVFRALCMIQEDKAPGMDGYTSLFFKKAWGIVGEDVSSVILEFFRTGCLLHEINSTVLHLIPKRVNASKASEFRPIACCSTLYKIIAKMICERLTEVLPCLVDEPQSAFVSGRTIVDNVLLCQELMAGYDWKNISPRCVEKIDLRKAYDSVLWEFVSDLLLLLGFSMGFVRWVMACISSVSYSINVNGELMGYFEGRRGLR
ncbi:hypothetical protein Dimus_038162 [Dionaea muscipula]